MQQIPEVVGNGQDAKGQQQEARSEEATMLFLASHIESSLHTTIIERNLPQHLPRLYKMPTFGKNRCDQANENEKHHSKDKHCSGTKCCRNNESLIKMK